MLQVLLLHWRERWQCGVRGQCTSGPCMETRCVGLALEQIPVRPRVERPTSSRGPDPLLTRLRASTSESCFSEAQDIQ